MVQADDIHYGSLAGTAWYGDRNGKITCAAKHFYDLKLGPLMQVLRRPLDAESF